MSIKRCHANLYLVNMTCTNVKISAVTGCQQPTYCSGKTAKIQYYPNYIMINYFKKNSSKMFTDNVLIWFSTSSVGELHFLLMMMRCEGWSFWSDVDQEHQEASTKSSFFGQC